MDIIVGGIHNNIHKDLHRDFLVETCRSFNVDLFDKNKKYPEGNIIALRHDKGEHLHEVELGDIDTVLIGCDDSGEDGWMEEYRSIKIATPVNYFLWSGVALGIFLYHVHINLKNNHL